MSSSYQVNLVDRSNERTSVRIPIMPVQTGTIASIATFEAAAPALVGALTLLSVTGESLNKVTRVSHTLPTGDNAVRELAVRFVMYDSAENQATFSIGGPDLSEFPFTVGEGGDIYEWDSGDQSVALEAFVTAMLLVARHPITNDQMTLRRLELIGRNN